MSNQADKAKVIYLQPAFSTTNITKGVCTQCGYDLNALLAKIMKNKEDLPEQCPNCKRRIEGEVTRKVVIIQKLKPKQSKEENHE